MAAVEANPGYVSEYDRPPRTQLIEIRWDTYSALKSLKMDNSSTFDMLIREALKRRYPFLDL